MQLVPIRDGQQRRQMLELLAEGFPAIKLDWSSAFSAPAGNSGHGWLMMIEGDLAGGILAFEKTERIRGTLRPIVNLSSWYIRPPYRKFAVRMMREISADPAIYTIFSPVPSVQKICLRVGYRYVSRGSIASLPFINGMGLGTGMAIEPFAPGLQPNADHDRWMADHDDGRHIGLLIRQGSSVVPALWLRGLKVRGLPAARLLFTGDHRVLRAALARVHWHMLTAHGIVGLYLPRVAPYADVRSARKPDRGPSIIVKGEIADEDVDLLYSELLYLRAPGR